MSNTDPTHAEMSDLLYTNWDPNEITSFAVEEAIYWFAHDYHGGQWSNLYAALSGSSFKPGVLMRGPTDDSVALAMYDRLCEEYGS